jgi:CheY-like chemotaxis protein
MKPIQVLFLDDDLTRHAFVQAHFRDWIARKAFVVDRVFTAEQAIKALKRDQYFLVCLDHDLESSDDLADEPASGMAVAQYIALHMPRKIMPTWVHVHSWNGPASRRMVETLRDGVLESVTAAPFAPKAKYWDAIATTALHWKALK